MKTLTTMAAALFGILLFATSSPAQTREVTVVDKATNVLNEFMMIPNRSIPRSMLQRAQGLVVIPGMLKVGFIGGIRRGKGIVLVRDENGAWRPPMFVTMTGGSVGWQVGVQSTDVILVFMTRRSVNGLISGKFTIGADATAAAGPVGRQAAAATDARLQAEILSYSRSRGLFAGVSVDGSVLGTEPASNQAYYAAAGMSPNGIPMAANAQLPPSAARLLSTVATYSSAPVAAPSMPSTAGTMPPNAGTMPPSPAGTVPGVPGVPPAAGTVPSGIPPYTAPPARNNPLPGASGMASTVPSPHGHAPLQMGPPPASLETTRLRIVELSPKLGQLLDESWRQYFSMPGEIFTGVSPPPMDKLNTLIDRFSRVTKDPRYAELTRRLEFQQMYQLLQTYRDQLQAASAQHNTTLPPGARVR